MTTPKIVAAAFLFAIAAGSGANAQSPYPPYPYYRPAPTPPSWSYDPYTSGLAGCPQWHNGDLTPCREKMPPTYGQPDYWPR